MKEMLMFPGTMLDLYLHAFYVQKLEAQQLSTMRIFS